MTEDVQKDAEDSDAQSAEQEESEAEEFYVSEIPDDIFEKIVRITTSVFRLTKYAM